MTTLRTSFLITLIVFSTIVAHAQYESQIKSITQELSKKISETSKKRIAVADFTDSEGTVTKLGQFISEEFNTYLPESGHGFEVIDRTRINTLIKENQLLRKGLTDPTAAAQLGKLANIEALVYGTITPFGESVRVNIKILDIQRGTIIRSLIGSITRTADINRLLSEASSGSGSGTGVDTDDTSGENATKDKDKRCATNHTGSYCFQNLTKQDIKIQTVSSQFTIHPNQTECIYGANAGSTGEYTYPLYIYRNAKEGTYETRQIVVTECQEKKFIVR